MTFKIKGAIFKNTAEKLQQRLGDRYDATKKYPDCDGLCSVKEEERMALASYIMNADANEKGEIPIRITGYNNTSQQSGVKYLGLSLEPDWKTMKGIEEKQVLNHAAKSLATATDGTVIEAAEDDLF